MTAFEDSTISYLFDQIDAVGANLVAHTYHQLVSHYVNIFYVLTSVYIGFIFIKMMRGLYDFNDFSILLLRTVIILTLCLNYDYFCLFIYNILTNEPLTICKAMTIKGSAVNSLSVSHALDNFLASGAKASSKIFMMGSWTNITYFVFGTFLFILVLLSTAVAAGLIVIAKCASTVLFALSPIFIFFALFDSTKGFFESYLRQLISYALIPIMTCAVLMILLSISDIAMQSFNSHQQPNFFSIFPLSLVCIIEIYLLAQVKGKCSALAGGFTLPGVITALRQMKNNAGSIASRAQFIHSDVKSAVGGYKNILNRLRNSEATSPSESKTKDSGTNKENGGNDAKNGTKKMDKRINNASDTEKAKDKK